MFALLKVLQDGSLYYVTVCAYSILGNVPAFYRELFEVICGGQERIDFDTFQSLLGKSGLAKQSLSTVSARFIADIITHAQLFFSFATGTFPMVSLN